MTSCIFYCFSSINIAPLSVLEFFVLVTISFFSSKALRVGSDRGVRERKKEIKEVCMVFLFGGVEGVWV